MHAVVFTIDESRYAVPLTEVVEVVRAVAVTPLPGAPPVIDGVIDVRGTVVPVLDTRRRFGHPTRPVSPDERFVIARAAARQVALRADAVEQLLEVDASTMTPRDATVAAADHVVGIVRLADGLVVVHDVARFLSAAESAALDEALAPASAASPARPDA